MRADKENLPLAVILSAAKDDRLWKIIRDATP